MWERIPKKVLDGVYKGLSVMGVTSMEKVESASYQLRNVYKIMYTQRKDNRPEESGSIEWREFKKDFLRKYFPVRGRKLR